MEIIFSGVEYRYMQGTPFETLALTNIDIEIPSGSFVAIIGSTGSGKSTFVQHINGLLKPTKGTVQVGPFTLKADEKNVDLKPLRKEVGFVFQYPEHQLFAETVEDDICFGPLNFGMKKDVVLKKVKKWLPELGLSEELLASSPFSLSGGQMRRVAIAGVLAQEPSILVLDEPAAGLDPAGRKSIMDFFVRYHETHGTTTIFVTHHMEDAAKYAERIIVLNDGRIEMDGSCDLIFKEAEKLQQIGLDVPDTVRFLKSLQERFHLKDVPIEFEVDKIADFIASLVKEKVE